MLIDNAENSSAARVIPSYNAYKKAPVLTISIVSDYICPWCLVGETRLKKALAEVNSDYSVNIEWLPFELNPNMPKEGLDRKEYRTLKFGSWERSLALDEQVQSNAKPDGLEFRYDLIQRTPNTFDAHRLTWMAQHVGKADAIAERLLRAYFQEGKDIGDHAVLASLAAEVGINEAQAREFLDSDEGVAEVQELIQNMRRKAISGVPFITIGNESMSGAQSVSTFKAAIEQALVSLREEDDIERM